MTIWVYKAYDRADSLLYVGVTNNIDTRLASHAQQSGWWIFHERVETLEFDDRAEAEAAERLLIQTEHPRWNRKDRVAEAPAGIRERYKVEERVWREVNRLGGKRSQLLAKLEAIESELRVLAFAIEGMSGGIADPLPTATERKRASLRALVAGESS